MATITTYSGTPANSFRVGDDNARYYGAQQFTATATGTLSSLKFYQRLLDGTPTDGLKVEIWADSGADTPCGLIASATQTIASGDIVDGGNTWSTSENTTVTFSSPAVVENTIKYWVVMYRAGSVDASNYRNMWTVDGGSTYADGIWMEGTNAKAWTLVSGRDQALEITITESTQTSNFGSLDLESGSSQYATAADSASLSITGDMTIEAWVKFESSASNHTLVSKWDTASNRSYVLKVRSSDVLFQISSDGSAGTDGSIAYTETTGAWHHFAITYDASAGTMEAFVDGISIGTDATLATSIYDGNSLFKIGAGDGDLFDGLIDEVRVWNDIRTVTEIANNKNAQLVGNEANLVGYWRLNNSAQDLTANNNHLTFVASPVFSTDVSVWAVGPTNLKTLNTNLSANIKSINTNLIANVKSLNTNT